MPHAIQVKKRLAVAAVVLLGIAAALILHHRSQRSVRTYVFSQFDRYSVHNITWIDQDNLFALIEKRSGDAVIMHCDIGTGKSYPVADLATQPPNSLIRQLMNATDVEVSPDGKFIAGNMGKGPPWIFPLDNVLMPLPAHGTYRPSSVSWSQQGIVGSIRWLPDGQHWINLSMSGEIAVFDRSGRKISSFAGPPPTVNFLRLLGGTAAGNIWLLLSDSPGTPNSIDMLISIDSHTGNSTKISLLCPADLRNGGNWMIDLSPRGDKVAWLGVMTPHDWMPGWLHDALLKIGVNASPKKQYVVIVGDLRGRNTHTVLSVDAKDAMPMDFGWLPDGRSVYVDLVNTNQSLSAIHRIIEAPVD